MDCLVLGEKEAETMVENKNLGEVISLLFIPKVKDVNVNSFHLKASEMRSHDETKLKTKLDKLVDKDIKFLYLICAKSVLPKHLNKMWSNTIKVL